MVVVVLCTSGTRVGMVVPNGLEDGQGVREYVYLFVCGGRGKGRVYGYEIRSHDGPGLFYPRNIYVYGSAGGNVHHCRP